MQHEWHRRPLERFASERSASLLGKPDGWRLGCRQRGRSRPRWRPPTLVSLRNYQLLESCFINRANHAASPPADSSQPSLAQPSLTLQSFPYGGCESVELSYQSGQSASQHVRVCVCVLYVCLCVLYQLIVWFQRTVCYEITKSVIDSFSLTFMLSNSVHI